MKFRCVFRNPNQHMDSTKKNRKYSKTKKFNHGLFYNSMHKNSFFNNH